MKALLMELKATIRASTPKYHVRSVIRKPEKPDLRLRQKYLSLSPQQQQQSFDAAEALERANGYCERCRATAPFKRAANGSPYLEVHHVVPLAEGGEDSIENATALCPNCHRELHFGKSH
jgi:5-methylcytosine-specific restriction protein A